MVYNATTRRTHALLQLSGRLVRHIRSKSASENCAQDRHSRGVGPRVGSTLLYAPSMRHDRQLSYRRYWVNGSQSPLTVHRGVSVTLQHFILTRQ